MKARRRRALAAVAVSLGVVHSVRAAELEPPLQIQPLTPLTVDLAAGETLTFEAKLSSTSPWRVAVEQLGIDVVVEVRSSDGELVTAVDRPLDRDGTEYALWTPDEASIFRIVVRSRELSAPAGRVRISLEDLSWSTPRERARWIAELAETEAAAAYFLGGGEGRRRALAAYREALVQWRAASDAGREALAVYSIGVLHRLLGEMPQALEFDRQAETLLAALGERRWQASALNEMGMVKGAMGEIAQAVDFFERAVQLLESESDPFRQVMSQRNACLMLLYLGEFRQGIECYRSVEQLSRLAGDSQGDAMAMTNNGRAYDMLGEPDRAIESYEKALAIQQAHGDAHGEALTLNNLAVLHGFRGDHQRALALYGSAAELHRSLGNHGLLALALSNIGNSYRALGETPRARDFFEQALSLQRESGSRRDEAQTLADLAPILAHEGDSKALALFREALALRRQIGDRRGEGRALYDLGSHLAALGEAEEALANLTESLAIAVEAGDKASAARAQLGIGEALTHRLGSAQASDRLAAAVGLYRTIRGSAGLARALTASARLARERGAAGEARVFVNEAIDAIESLRVGLASPGLKAAFLASRREAYELDIALWMDRHRASPEQGFDARALEASERARARTVLELLNEAGSGLAASIGADLAADRQRLQERLDRSERKRIQLVGRVHTAEELNAQEAEIEGLLTEFDVLEAEIYRANPELSALARPEILDASDMQRLVDPGTVLLVYSLGRERSFLWWLAGQTLESHELPAQAEVETLARRAFDQLSTLDAGSGAGRDVAIAELSRAVLGPVAARLDGQRLVVVADGALHHVPFAALLRSGAGDSLPLMAHHEIVHLPSASTLALQRRLRTERATAPELALVVADPIFGRDDPRVGEAGERERAPASASPTATRRVRQFGSEQLGRLPSTQREAESIVALAEAGDVTTAIGFGASREAILAADLERYRIIHFATHGLIDERSPRLSGLALSQVTEDGATVDGFLPLADIVGLKLNAELVVLSACRTASGREIRGEGLVSLTQGFMYAGASRVMASLWPVQDRATAELMAEFYRALWIGGMSPAAALREAQGSLSRQRRWRDPYYWAGFVLQGDWR